MQYICSKTGDEGNIYVARQGMRACNNNNMRNPSLHLFYYGVTHVIIVACPQSLSCCIYTALVSPLFGPVIPTSFNILMEMFLLPCILYIYVLFITKYGYIINTQQQRHIVSTFHHIHRKYKHYGNSMHECIKE